MHMSCFRKALILIKPLSCSMQEPYFFLHMEAIGKSPCSVIVIFVVIFRVAQQLQGRKCWLEHFIPAAAQNSI